MLTHDGCCNPELRVCSPICPGRSGGGLYAGRQEAFSGRRTKPN